MHQYLVFGLPRSGTTWAANWLTQGSSYCYHDPLVYGPPEAFEAATDNRPGVHGISCTGSWLDIDWLRHHPAPVLILERDPADVQRAVAAAGLPALPDEMFDAFQRLDGLRVAYEKLFEPRTARMVWNYLLQNREPFDSLRHHHLSLMRVNTDIPTWAKYYELEEALQPQ